MGSLRDLKERVWSSSLELYHCGLAVQTFGNASGIDRDRAIVAIKPSGMPYRDLKSKHIVLVDLKGNPVDGRLKPSSDTATHLVLYKAFPDVGGIVHTHSRYATAWAQAKTPIPCFGTTHADSMDGDIPCTEDLREAQIQGAYEQETGSQIVRTILAHPQSVSTMVLVAGHGPFTWGKDPEEAVGNAVLLEEIARLAYLTLFIRPGAERISPALITRHYQRKHGRTATYGQQRETL